MALSFFCIFQLIILNSDDCQTLRSCRYNDCQDVIYVLSLSSQLSVKTKYYISPVGHRLTFF